MRSLRRLFMIVLFSIFIIGASDNAEAKVIKTDLNGDGTKETIKTAFSGGQKKIYVNNTLCVSFKCDYSDLIEIKIVDVNKKDKYHEILVTSAEDYERPITLYRYDGKKLKRYAYGAYPCSIDVKVPGDGTVRSIVGICLKNTKKVYCDYGGGWKGNCIWNAYVVYNIKNGKLVVNTKKESKTAGSTMIFYANTKTNAYKKAGSKKKAFKLAKNEAFRVTSTILGKAKTYFKIKTVKSKKTGWISIPSKDIVLESFYMG